MVQVSQQFGGFVVTTIGVSPQNDNFRIVGRNDGKLWGTTTGTNPLTDLGAGNVPALPAKAAARVVIDPNNTSVAYATYSGFGLAAGQHVWKTTSFGTAATWTVSGTGIPDVPVDSIVVDPLDSNRVYAATDIGVYASSDAGATWAPLGTGLPRVAVFDLAIQSPNRILRVATHGRGMWELLVPGPITPVVTVSLASSTPSVITGNSNDNEKNKGQTKEERAQQLLDVITSTIQPDIWQVNGGTAAIRFFNGNLIVTAPRSVHEALGGFVE